MRKSTFVFIVLSGVASFFNYATYPALARVLSRGQFVDITVSLALFTQLSSFMLTIVALTIGLSKQESERDSKDVIEKLQTVLIHLFLTIIVGSAIAAPWILSRLHLTPPLLIPIFAMLLLSVSMSVISGFLNGKQKLVKLGVIVAFLAVIQFIFSVGAGIITKNGAISLGAMALGSLITIVLAYLFYKKDGLPRPTSIFIHKFNLYKSKKMRAIIKYTIFSSLAAMLANILLIIDLLLVNNRQIDASTYTDLYIVSRIVFFSGMLFVWPFLSNIDIYYPRRNMALLLKLSGLFIFITLGAVAIMALFGEQVIQILLGSNSYAGSLKLMAILSILYKFIFLLIITLVLYFIVLRSYWAIGLPLIVGIGVGVTLVLLGDNVSTIKLITALNITTALSLMIGLVGFVRVSASPGRDPK